MRLWTIHPRYLDGKGLTALWREGLLARAVLHGMTRGYTRHPQLIRFRSSSEPLAAIDAYLTAVLAEACERGYHFDASKIDVEARAECIVETSGQLQYEWEHLMKKLAVRDKERWQGLAAVSHPESHPLFSITQGAVRDWEKR